MVDSGATANIISKTTYERLEPCPQLKQTATKIFPYRSKVPLPVVGAFEGQVTKGNKQSQSMFYVIQGDSFSILSYDTSTELGLIKIVTSLSPMPTTMTVAEELVSSYPELFEGIGKLKDFQVKLHINPDVQPTCQPHRRVPFHVRQKVEDELQKLEADDIIETVSGPTPWVSPIVTPSQTKGPRQSENLCGHAPSQHCN